MALLRSQPGVVAVTDNVARGGCWRPPTGILLLNEPRVESLNCWEGREAIQQLQQQQQESEEKKAKQCSLIRVRGCYLLYSWLRILAIWPVAGWAYSVLEEMRSQQSASSSSSFTLLMRAQVFRRPSREPHVSLFSFVVSVNAEIFLKL